MLSNPKTDSLYLSTFCLHFCTIRQDASICRNLQPTCDIETWEITRKQDATRLLEQVDPRRRRLLAEQICVGGVTCRCHGSAHYHHGSGCRCRRCMHSHTPWMCPPSQPGVHALRWVRPSQPPPMCSDAAPSQQPPVCSSLCRWDLSRNPAVLRVKARARGRRLH